jgi:hypothetical protein
VSDSALLARLAELARDIEAHRTAIWLLEQQRDELRNQLRAEGWTPATTAPDRSN